MAHESKEEPHEQQCHLRPVCLNHLGDVVVEVVHRHFLQAAASPLHEVIYFLSATRLEQNIQNLENEVRAREDFIAAFSHELKTPLTSIIGYADMLRSTPMTEEETMEAANYIFQQGKRLESLSFKLLELIVTDKQQYQFRMISVERLVNEAVRLTREKREERKIALHLGLEEGEIFGERDLLLSVLVNLLDNSRKAVRTGGRIQILGRNYGKTYELCISDNGCGMDDRRITTGHRSFLYDR